MKNIKSSRVSVRFGEEMAGGYMTRVRESILQTRDERTR